MKKVFSTHNEVAHIWAQNTQSEGRSGDGRLFFEDGTIYSYGHHFPIARIMNDGTVLFTKKGYSISTSKHTSLALGAISHREIIYAYEIPGRFALGVHEKNLNRWKEQIKNLLSELSNIRIRNKGERIAGIQRNVQELETYVNYFRIKIQDKELKEILKLVKASNLEAQLKEFNAEKERKEEAKKKRIKKGFNKFLKAWHEGKEGEFIKNLSDKERKDIIWFKNISGFDYLRYNKVKDRVETSQFVQVPAAIAKKVYFELQDAGAFNNDEIDVNIKVTDYTIVKAGKVIVAGCHRIPVQEAHNIAKLLHWKKSLQAA